MSVWCSLKAIPEELRLDTTLKCGQSFRWKLSGENEWSCAFKGKLITLRQTATGVEYRTYFHSDFQTSSQDKITVEKQRQREIDQEYKEIHEFLVDYFQLHVNLRERYDQWSLMDKHFARIANQFPGIRILRQDPVENVICFICSTNNNIARISQMIEKLCRKYGQKVYTLDGQEYFDFPTLDKLVSPKVEEELQQLGFGYRARYIAQTARILKEKYPDGEQWLHSLRKLEYKDARAALLQLTGVGPKVADCVCLMSLDKNDAIPVDTHVWQIAKREYGFGGKGETRNMKTLTSRLYEAVGDHFRKLFGDYSGWAHSVLFTADLKAFEDRQNNLGKLKPTTLTSELTINNKRRRL
ncbi:16347_t:CDS:2 [Acaulospora morrowiae]|uniref:N-glycosylase/DNA lyase n=1 Tax=Acaulospora morrowiae TaxID=94023 RepID=A0A9N9C798_9GLOM|nr:16347_t:CDS:2 [Acaulospora morrowiae]